MCADCHVPILPCASRARFTLVKDGFHWEKREGQPLAFLSGAFFFRGCQLISDLVDQAIGLLFSKEPHQLEKREVVASNKSLMCSHQVSHYIPHAAAFYDQEVRVNAQ